MVLICWASYCFSNHRIWSGGLVNAHAAFFFVLCLKPYPSHPYCCESLNALHLYTHPLSPSPNTAPSLWTVIWIIVTSFNSFNRISFHNSERRHNSSVGNPQYSGKYTTGSWSGAWLGSAAIADSAKTMTWCRRQRP
jgi:hypothetical protein